jgi:hypothetical protein
MKNEDRASAAGVSVHRTVVLVLAVCAVVLASSAAEGSENVSARQQAVGAILDTIGKEGFLLPTFGASGYEAVAQITSETPEVRFLLDRQGISLPMMHARYRQQSANMPDEVRLVYFVVFGLAKDTTMAPDMVSYVRGCRTVPIGNLLWPWHPFLHGVHALEQISGDQVRAPSSFTTLDWLDGFLSQVGTWEGHVSKPTEESSALFPVQVGGMWGYMDTTGKLVIRPQFDAPFSFSEGLAPVFDKHTHAWGYIDKTGRFVIRPRFGDAGVFSEGLAAITVESVPISRRRWGYVDTAGRLVISPQFIEARRFSGGCAAVQVSDSGTDWGIINTTGSLVSPLRFDGVWDFTEGLAVAQVKAHDTIKYCYIDGSGSCSILPQFLDASSFSEHLAAVLVGDRGTGKWGYVDANGDFAIKPGLDSAGQFSEGLAAVRLSDGDTSKYGYIDRTGRLAIEPQFDLARDFHDGLAAVRIGDYATGKWGYIDTTGKFVIGARFDAAYDFSHGLAGVRVDGKKGELGYIDKTGKFVWKPTK